MSSPYLLQTKGQIRALSIILTCIATNWHQVIQIMILFSLNLVKGGLYERISIEASKNIQNTLTNSLCSRQQDFKFGCDTCLSSGSPVQLTATCFQTAPESFMCTKENVIWCYKKKTKEHKTLQFPPWTPFPVQYQTLIFISELRIPGFTWILEPHAPVLSV